MSSFIDFDVHPVNVIHKLIDKHGFDLTFTYSLYTIAPPGRQATAERSPTYRIAANEISSDWLLERFSRLGERQEIAFHSRVESASAAFHIPMIDFAQKPTATAISEFERWARGELGVEGCFAFFSSGRSFHAYFPDLISEHEWCGYLGNLLLLNQEDHLPVVDVRWVGHALIRGFAALRWSCNTKRYRAMPHRVRIDTLRS